jgi:hypothetical protein
MSDREGNMRFEAEIKEVKSKKLASLDLEYRVIFTTNNPEVLSLGAINPETMVVVEVTPDA